MPTVSSLNVRLGLLSKEFERDLKRVERQLQQSGQRLAQLGSEMTTAFTLPILGIGAAAIKSAGDIESLRLALTSTMQDGGRSIEEANAELEALRQAALAPGLDFEQAVKGSIRLQNVGFAAEEARGILIQLANAISLTGGTAQELDGVTRQFTQMIAKGRIMQEDLTIIQENMPAISKAMDEAFGTRSAEKLRELGVTAEDFIAGVTEQFQKLPRVAGGINNALVNVFSGLKQQAARLGEEINKVFNIGDTADKIVEGAKRIVDAFASLDDGTKRLIIQMAGLLAIAGPVISVFGTLKNAAGTLVGVFGNVVGSIRSAADAFKVFNAAQAAKGVGSGIKVLAADLDLVKNAAAGGKAGIAALTGSIAQMSSVTAAAKNADFAKTTLAPISAAAPAAATGISRVTLAVKTLGATTKVALAATGVGLLLVALGAGIELWSAYSNEVEKAAKVAELHRAVAEEASKETAILNKNFEVLKTVTASTEERTAAIKELQSVYPNYLKGVDLEKSSISELTEIQGRLNAEILRGVAERQKSTALNKVYEEQAKILLRIQEIRRTGKTTISEAGLIDTGDMIRAGSIAGAVIAKMQEQAAALGKQATVVGNDFDKAFGLGAKSASRQYDAITKQRQALEDAKDALEDMTPAQREALAFSQKWDAVMSKKGSGGGLVDRTKEYKKALDSIRAVSEKGDVLGADLFNEQVNEISNQIERLIEVGFKPYGKEVQSLRDMLVKLQADTGQGLISANVTQTTLAELDKIEKAIGDVNDAFEPIQIDPPVVDPTVEAIEKVSDALAKIKSPPPLVLAPLTPEVGQVPQIPGLELPKQVVSIETGDAIAGLGALKDAASEATDQMSAAQERAMKIAEIFETSQTGLYGFAEALKAAADFAAESGDVLGSVVVAIGDSVASAAAQGAQSFGELANAAIKAGADIVRSWIQQGVAAAVSKALSSLPFPFNLAAGAIAGAAAVTLFNKAISSIGIPALAEGGVASGPTLALIGEYPGAKSNPEIVAPESKLRKIYGEETSKALRDTNKPALTPVSEIQRIFERNDKSTFERIGEVMRGALNTETNNNTENTTRTETVFERFLIETKKVFADTVLPPTETAVSVNQPEIIIPGIKAVLEPFLNLPDLSRIKIPALATGGVFSGPSLALIGEYAGAATNHEIVSPENKLREIYREESQAGGSLVAVVRGDDLQFILDKAAARRGRIRGN